MRDLVFFTNGTHLPVGRPPVGIYCLINRLAGVANHHTCLLMSRLQRLRSNTTDGVIGQTDAYAAAVGLISGAGELPAPLRYVAGAAQLKRSDKHRS